MQTYRLTRDIPVEDGFDVLVAGGGPDEGHFKAVTQDLDTILRDSERLVRRWHRSGPGAMTQIALAPCSPFSVSADLMRESAALAEQLEKELRGCVNYLRLLSEAGR